MRVTDAPEIRPVRTRQGHRIQVRRWPGRPPAVLALHGLAHSAAVWGPVVSWMTDGAEVLAPDLRGHGDSSWSDAGEYGLDSMASDVAAVLDERVGDHPVVLVGHSLGGKVAAEVMARRPDDVKAMVIIEAGPAMPPRVMARLGALLSSGARSAHQKSGYLSHLAGALPLLGAGELRWLASELTRSNGDGTLHEKVDPQVVRRWTGGVPGELGHVADRVAAVLGGRHCPVTLVRAAASAVVTRASAADLLDRGLVDDVVEVPRATHAVVLDDPRAVAGIVQRVAAASRTDTGGSEAQRAERQGRPT